MAETPFSESMFHDAQGDPWAPRLTTPVIMAICRECGITIAALMSISIGLDAGITALWLACECQAKKREVTREQFLGELVPPAVLPDALKALWAAAREAFPQLGEIKGAGPSAGPFVPSISRILSSLSRPPGQT